MRFGAALTLAVTLAVVGCASTPRETEIFESEGRPAGAGDRALLAGVPYVSWNEAARLWFRERDLANPSSHAGFLMVLNFHFATSAFWSIDFLRDGTGLPVLGGLLAIAISGSRLPFSISK